MRLCNCPRTAKTKRWFFLAIQAATLGLIVCCGAWAFEEPDSSKPGTVKVTSEYTPAAIRLKQDVSFLADDAREGRAPGTKGIEAAADYIAGVFKAAGLKPAPGADGYFQTFTINGTPTPGKDQKLSVEGPDGKTIQATNTSDFTPLAIGIGATVEKVPIVFAGYGITAHEEARKLDYDDYAGIDVKGKAVLVIRRKPREQDASSPFGGPRSIRYSAFQHKATNAFQHGAAALLIVNDSGEAAEGQEKLLRFGEAGDQPFSNIPVVMVSRAFADKLLTGAGQPRLGELEKQIDADLKPRSKDLKGWTLSEKIVIDRSLTATKNVIGVLEGSGPHAEESVVLGGHYDHLGRGGLTSGSLAFLSRDIHNGADDNASGTSMVLELARRLGARKDPLPRRVVFMAFSGEERGLLGSAYYVQHPLYPLSSTVMMFNCDMVGRLNDKSELTMIGTGTSPGLGSLVDVLGKSAGLTIKQVAGMTDGFGGSDHQSFYPKGIPVLFAFTGVHRDYHRPSDDSDLINYTGMARIADYLELLLLDVTRRPNRPALTRVTPPAPTHGGGGTDPARMGSGVYVGTRPDYSYEGKDGMKIDGVGEGSPAEKGGLKGGDLITRFGDKPVGTIYDFMESMSQYKPGNKVDVVVKRAGKEVKLQITLGSRPGGR